MGFLSSFVASLGLPVAMAMAALLLLLVVALALIFYAATRPASQPLA
jgi:ABC-type transport system involved in cytochrome bd biosynthesis fused ATPase/permease subunit